MGFFLARYSRCSQVRACPVSHRRPMWWILAILDLVPFCGYFGRGSALGGGSVGSGPRSRCLGAGDSSAARVALRPSSFTWARTLVPRGAHGRSLSSYTPLGGPYLICLGVGGGSAVRFALRPSSATWAGTLVPRGGTWPVPLLLHPQRGPYLIGLGVVQSHMSGSPWHGARRWPYGATYRANKVKHRHRRHPRHG